MSAAPSEPQSLGDAAYQQLWADIMSCRLAPGQRLTERSLAQSTGYGISPIREALTRLDHEGLIRTLPRKGYQVTPMTLKSVDDLFTLWRVIGPEIARLGVQDATADQHRQLLDVIRQLAELQKRSHTDDVGTQLRVMGLVDEVFSALAAATRNEYLITICRRLQNDTTRIWALTAQGGVQMPDVFVAQGWVPMIERRDSAAAADAVSTALADVHRQALRVLSRWPSVAASEITALPATSG